MTFHNLLALHNTLTKNDDAGAATGVHITLGTRPNCLLRLKDLVGGASSGKGLSSFQSTSSRMDESSDESAEAEAESDDSSPDGEAEEMQEEDEEEEKEEEEEEDDDDDDEDNGVGVDVDMAGSLDDQSVASQGFAEAATEEAGGVELETPVADEDEDEDEADADTGAVHEANYGDYTNGDDEDTANGVLLGPNGVSELATPRADVGDDLDYAAAQDEKNLEQADDLDLLEDINDDGELVSHDQDGAVVEAAADLEHAEGDVDHNNLEEGNGENDDDFLDLNGDIDETVASAETLEANTKAGDVESLVETSATATLHHDEIDYEENNAGESREDAPLNTTVDEIDWDVELKNAASTSPSASTKRAREADESGDALLDELPGMVFFVVLVTIDLLYQNLPLTLLLYI